MLRLFFYWNHLRIFAFIEPIVRGLQNIKYKSVKVLYIVQYFCICLVYIVIFNLLLLLVCLWDGVRLPWRHLSPVRQMERSGWWTWDPGPGPIRRARRTGAAAPAAWTTAAWHPPRSRLWAAVLRERGRPPAPIAPRFLPPPSRPLHLLLLLRQETPQPACLRWLLQWRKGRNPLSHP